MQTRIIEPPYRPAETTRSAERIGVTLPARLMWKDQRGATRFASVVTRNVSEFGAYVECPTPVSLPLYRLVQFQLERDTCAGVRIPETMKRGRVTAAVYRVNPADSKGRGQGIALRLMVEPKRRQAAEPAASAAVQTDPVRVRASA